MQIERICTNLSKLSCQINPKKQYLFLRLVNQFLTNWNPSGWLQTLGCLGCCLELTRHAVTTLTKSLYLKSNPTPLTIYSPTWALQWSLFQSLLALHVWRSVFKPKRKPVHFIWGEGNGNPLQYSCLENPVDRGAWWAAVHEVAQSQTQVKRLSLHACIGEGNGNRSSNLAWRIPETEKPGGLLSVGLHRVGHD